MGLLYLSAFSGGLISLSHLKLSLCVWWKEGHMHILSLSHLYGMKACSPVSPRWRCIWSGGRASCWAGKEPGDMSMEVCKWGSAGSFVKQEHANVVFRLLLYFCSHTSEKGLFCMLMSSIIYCFSLSLYECMNLFGPLILYFPRYFQWWALFSCDCLEELDRLLLLPRYACGSRGRRWELFTNHFSLMSSIKEKLCYICSFSDEKCSHHMPCLCSHLGVLLPYVALMQLFLVCRWYSIYTSPFLFLGGLYYSLQENRFIDSRLSLRLFWRWALWGGREALDSHCWASYVLNFILCTDHGLTYIYN